MRAKLVNEKLKGQMKLLENNVSPYDKIGQYMLKKMGVKTPFKKKKARGNQNSMKQTVK